MPLVSLKSDYGLSIHAEAALLVCIGITHALPPRPLRHSPLNTPPPRRTFSPPTCSVGLPSLCKRNAYNG